MDSKELARQRAKEYYYANREHVLKRIKTKRLSNLEHARAYERKIAQERKPINNERARQWYIDNKELMIKRAAEWKKNNPDKVRISTRNYHSRKRAAGKFTNKDYMRLFNRLLGKCGYCGINNADTIDHIVPLSRGGSNFIGNIMPACGSCNYSKQHKTIMEWKHGRVLCTRDTALYTTS